MDAMAQVLIVRQRLSILALSLLSRSVLGTNGNCDTAFHQPGDTHVQVACQVNNVRMPVYYSVEIRFADILCFSRLTWLSPSVSEIDLVYCKLLSSKCVLCSRIR